MDVFHTPETSTKVDTTKDKQMSLKQEQFHSVVASAPEPIGTIVGKLGVIWVGLFAGLKLGDLVLIATLVYTLLQTCMLIVERIIKPLWALRAEHKAAQAARLSSVSNSQEN